MSRAQYRPMCPYGFTTAFFVLFVKKHAFFLGGGRGREPLLSSPPPKLQLNNTHTHTTYVRAHRVEPQRRDARLWSNTRRCRTTSGVFARSATGVHVRGLNYALLTCFPRELALVEHAFRAILRVGAATDSLRGSSEIGTIQRRLA